MVKYIFQFAQSHPNFRLAELESVALLQNVALDPNDLLNHKQDSPFLILNLESDVEALALCDRCVLLRHVYEFYAQEKDFESLVSLVKCSTGEKGVLKVIEEKYSNARFKFLVKAYNHTIGSEESVKMINRFSFLPLRGGVSMKKAQVTFCIVSEYACASKVYEQPEILMAYFGRYVGSGRRDLIDKYNLKKRAYIGTTSMEAEISLVSANMALARKGALIYDPFVGTGSFLVTCSEFGAYTMGSELDGRKVRGNAGSGGKSIHCNSKQYGISNRVLDLFVFDVNTMPFSDRFCFFDAIITDPPYGVREGARKIASSSTTVNNADATTANINSGLDCNLECGEKKETIVTRFPETEPYHVEDVISDLVQMAAKRLIIGGRLVYWIPLTKDENGNFQGQKPPTHPALKIISDCEQEFSVWSRRLVVMEKICPFSEDMKPMQEIENPVQGTFRDRYFNLNNTRKMMMMQDKKLNLFDPLGITVEETNFGCKIYLRRKEKETISSSHHDDSNNNSRCRDKKFVLHRCILFEDKVALVPITYSIKPGQTHKSLFFCLLKASSRANHHAFMTLYEWREAGKIDVHGLKMFDHQNQSDGDGVFCISLPFSKTVGMAERSDGFSMIQEPLNAESWKHENWKNISCKNCKSVVILEKGPNTQVLNLPSEHWMEFVDCWVCHDDQELFVRHTELKPKSKDQILVGMKEILISSFESFESFESTKSSKSSKSSISILSSSPSLSDNDKIDILSCPKCGLKLGKKFSSHLALEKTGIQINFDDKPQKSITCTPESFVSHQIFNHVMDHSIYRFCINDRLFLRIVNWDLWVNFPGSSDRLNGRALKCLFAFDCPDDSSICDPKVRSSTNMEFIECSNEVVEMLIERLKEFSFLFDSNPSLSYLFL